MQDNVIFGHVAERHEMRLLTSVGTYPEKSFVPEESSSFLSAFVPLFYSLVILVVVVVSLCLSLFYSYLVFSDILCVLPVFVLIGTRVRSF